MVREPYERRKRLRVRCSRDDHQSPETVRVAPQQAKRSHQADAPAEGMPHQRYPVQISQEDQPDEELSLIGRRVRTVVRLRRSTEALEIYGHHVSPLRQSGYPGPPRERGRTVSVDEKECGHAATRLTPMDLHVQWGGSVAHLSTSRTRTLAPPASSSLATGVWQVNVKSCRSCATAFRMSSP